MIQTFSSSSPRILEESFLNQSDARAMDFHGVFDPQASSISESLQFPESRFPESRFPESLRFPERLRAKRIPVRVKKTHQTGISRTARI
jgi:hypothetical protein